MLAPNGAASFAGNTNYKPTRTEKTITIERAEATVNLTWASPQTYNGNASGVGDGDGAGGG